MAALAQAHPEIERLGATLIGLSPLAGTDGCSFPLLRDWGCRIAARYRIAFRVPRQFRTAYRALGYTGAKTGSDRWVFPLPATYVIDRNGLVALSYVDADYATRLEPVEILAALAHLGARAK
jgi:peroxiredoxin